MLVRRMFSVLSLIELIEQLALNEKSEESRSKDDTGTFTNNDFRNLFPSFASLPRHRLLTAPMPPISAIERAVTRCWEPVLDLGTGS